MAMESNNPRHKSEASNLQLGLFVLFGVAVFVAMLFLIGQKRNLFEPTVTLQTRFDNVANLAIGAEVLLGGVVVGHVRHIAFPNWNQEESNLDQVTVVMHVSKKMLSWIRQDSIARISSRGLLGEKNINISIGSPKDAPVRNGDMIRSEPPWDLGGAFDEGQELLSHSKQTARQLQKFMDELIAQGADKAIAQSILSIRNLLRKAEKGEGLIHQLFYGKQEGLAYRQFMHHLAQDGKEILLATRNLLHQANEVLADVRTKPGLVHSLLYNQTGDEFTPSLAEAARDLRDIIASVKAGDGSIGRLLIDTTIYEDIKQILGTVRRNKVLKELVRYAISQQEES
ncbi:MAG: MlaD family protein [Myxococcota bacterium]